MDKKITATMTVGELIYLMFAVGDMSLDTMCHHCEENGFGKLHVDGFKLYDELVDEVEKITGKKIGE